MKTSNPTQCTGGRISFVDETQLVYVPLRETRADAVAALREVYRCGIFRPTRSQPAGRELVYPVDFCPTEDPNVFGVWFRNPDAELIECTLHVAHAREHATPGPHDGKDPSDVIDPFDPRYLKPTPKIQPSL